jgi:hypothetical protein
MPFSIIPERGQVAENSAKSPPKQSCDVFHDDDCGSYFANEAGVFPPEAAACSLKTFATACETNVLAGKSSNDSVGFNPVSVESIGGKLANIVINRNPGKALGKAGSGFGVDFAERDRLKAASALEANVKAGNPGEQRKRAKGRVHAASA